MTMSSTVPKFVRLSGITTYQAGVAQSSMHRLLQKECDEYLKEFGITKMQWLIIGTVLDAGAAGMRLTDLAEIMHTGLPYLTTTINLLESKDILVRSANKEDSRAKKLQVSENFQAKCPEIERTLRDRLRSSIYSKVTPEEFRIYMKVLYQLGSQRMPGAEE
jgi:DNA-binding MarR family transcriptional regulator